MCSWESMHAHSTTASEKQVEQVVAEKQEGFRAGTDRPTFTFDRYQRSTLKETEPYYSNFVDFKQIFDSEKAAETMKTIKELSNPRGVGDAT